MNIGLFIPNYADQFYPRVVIATLQLLEKFIGAGDSKDHNKKILQ